MSREKDTEEGDRRGLVEDGRIGSTPDDFNNKSSKTKNITEVEWVTDPVLKNTVVTRSPTSETAVKTIATSEQFNTLVKKKTKNLFLFG